MATDDELLARLGAVLEPEGRPIDPDRMAALRAAAAAHAAAGTDGESDETSGGGRAPDVAGRRSPWRALAPLLAVAAAVAAFVLGGALLGATDDPDREDLLAGGTVEFQTTLRSPDGDFTASATGILTGIGRTVLLRTDDLAILPKGQFYELWFVGPGDSPRSPNRISAGTFHPDDQGRSAVDLTAAVDPALYPELSITAEPGDGDPAATGPEVLRAEIELLDS